MRAEARSLFYLLLSACPPLCGQSRWIRIESPHFDIYSSAGESGTRETIRHFEQVRGFFSQIVTAGQADRQPVRLVLFGSANEYETYRMNEFAVAYYRSGPEFDYIVLSRTGPDVFRIAVHEFVHLLVRHSGLKLPPWLNEGLSELYSTLRPQGGKILIGGLVEGRRQALLREPWTPLSVILSADHDSPYYNEKDKAGSLYNEGWALTHMLALHDSYRSRFPRFVEAVHSGTPSRDALWTVFARTLSQVEEDLQNYLRGDRFQGLLVPATLAKVSADLPAGPAPHIEVKLMLADLLARPGETRESRRRLEDLAAAEPDRPEPLVALGYLAWRDGRHEDARNHFQKAFESGSQNPRMLWDLGRMAAPDHDLGIAVLNRLLEQQPGNTEARLELAAVQLRARQPGSALKTLAPVRKVPEADAPRMFRILAYAFLELGDLAESRKAANRLAGVAKTPELKRDADSLIQFLDSRTGSQPAAAPAFNEIESASVARPTLRRGLEPPSAPGASGPLQSVTGSFVQLTCFGEKAMFFIEFQGEKQSFLIEDRDNVQVLGVEGGTVTLQCGPQKPRKVRVEYRAPDAAQPDAAAVVRVIDFRQ